MLCILSLIDVTVGLKTFIVEVVMHMPLSGSLKNFSGSSTSLNCLFSFYEQGSEF